MALNLPPSALYQEISSLCKALSNSNRHALLDKIMQHDRSVEQLADLCDLSVANASQHLLQLKHAGLVEAKKEGKQVFYKLASLQVLNTILVLRSLSEDNLARKNHIEPPKADRAGVHEICRFHLLEIMAKEDVVILDMRSKSEFDEGHLPNAINLSIDDLTQQLETVDKNSTLVAYCSGPYCTFSEKAVEILRKNGYAAYHYKSGYPDWRIID